MRCLRLRATAKRKTEVVLLSGCVASVLIFNMSCAAVNCTNRPSPGSSISFHRSVGYLIYLVLFNRPVTLSKLCLSLDQSLAIHICIHIKNSLSCNE